MGAAVQKNWRSIAEASDEIADDRDVALAAVRQDFRAYQWCGATARSDLDVALAMAEQDTCALTVALEEFPMDRSVLLALAKRSPHVLAYLPEAMTADPEFSALAHSFSVAEAHKARQELPEYDQKPGPTKYRADSFTSSDVSDEGSEEEDEDDD